MNQASEILETVMQKQSHEFRNAIWFWTALWRQFKYFDDWNVGVETSSLPDIVVKFYPRTAIRVEDQVVEAVHGGGLVDGKFQGPD